MSLYKKTEKQGKNKRTAGVIFIFAVIIIIFLLLNQNQNSLYSVNVEGRYPIRIVGSEDFGKSILFDKNIQIEGGDTVVDALLDVADVTTTYGGGYVQSINGIRSQYDAEHGVKSDWFYYVNGFLASIGAALYKPQMGDVIFWDYHNWDEYYAVSAIIGSYPEPFLHGYNGKIAPTSIIYGDNFYDSANSLQRCFDDFGISASMKPFDELSENERQSNNLIFIDTFDNNLISSLNSDSEQLGWFVKFEDNQITTYDLTGEISNNFESGGLICATQNIYNPKGNWHCENVIWVVSGVNDDDVNCAASLLISNDLNIQNHASIVLVNDSVYQVP